MLPIYKLQDARKRAKVGRRDAGKAIKAHQDKVKRLEEGQLLEDIDALAKLYGHRAVLLSDAEYEIFGQFMAILANFGQNKGKSGE